MDENPYVAPESPPSVLESIKSRRAKRRGQELRACFTILGAMVLPFVLMSLYLLLAEAIRLEDFVIYLVAFSVCVVSGTTCLAKSPISSPWRDGFCIFYVPLVAYLLFYFTFLFIGVVYGRWL